MLKAHEDGRHNEMRLIIGMSVMTSWHGCAFRIINSFWGEPIGRQQVPDIRGVNVYFIRNLSNLLNKHSSCRWFDTTSRSCDFIVIFAVCHGNIEITALSQYHTELDCKHLSPKYIFWYTRTSRMELFLVCVHVMYMIFYMSGEIQCH